MGSFNLNIEVSLSRETLDVLRQFAPDLPAGACNCTAADQDLKTFVKETVVEFLEGLKKHTEEPVEGPEPETAQSPAPEAEAPQAAPEAPAAPAAAEITDSQLREKVKEAKDRTSAKAVRAVFSEMGISTSVECPQERRAELVERLDNLKP